MAIPDPARTPHPVTVKVARWLYLAGAAALLAMNIFNMVGINAGITRGLRNAAALTPQQLESARTVATAIGYGTVVLGFVFVAALLLFLWVAWRGAGLARVILTILAVLSLATAFGSTGLGAAAAILTIGATVLIWMPASNTWFQHRKEQAVSEQ